MSKSWIDKVAAVVFKANDRSKHEIPEGVWTKCESCEQVLYRSELERNLNVCPKCGHHMRIKARARLDAFLDQNTPRQELGDALEPRDVLKFKDLKRYKDRYTQAQKATGEKDALVVQKGTLKGIPVVACAFEFNFMAGSMGSVVGARFCLAAQECIKERRALICFSTSGGARMQESLLSLMQMAKTSAVLARMSEVNLPFISVMSDPTMGGVSASLAMLGDVNIAEPRALIGFAGPRVIEQTVREKLPEGFQQAEFLLDKGAIDMIVSRSNLRDEIAELVAKMMNFSFNGEIFVANNSYEQFYPVDEVKELKKTTNKRKSRKVDLDADSEVALIDAEAITSDNVEVVEAQIVDSPRRSSNKSKLSDEIDEASSKKSSTNTKRRSSPKLKIPGTSRKL